MGQPAELSAALVQNLIDAPTASGEGRIQAVLNSTNLADGPRALAGGVQMMKDMREKNIILGIKAS